MDIDTRSDLQNLIGCFTCGGTGELELRAGDVLVPIPCPGCGGPEPAWIEGYDDSPDLLNDMREEDRHGLLRDK